MKRDFNSYLAALGPAAPVKSLTELRAFNTAHARAGAIKYGQANLDISDEMDVVADKARYEADRARDLRLAGDRGFKAAIEDNKLDALLFPGWNISNLASRPGYPEIVVPIGAVRRRRRRRCEPVSGGIRSEAFPVQRRVHRVAVQRAEADQPRLRVRAIDEATRASEVS